MKSLIFAALFCSSAFSQTWDQRHHLPAYDAPAEVVDVSRSVTPASSYVVRFKDRDIQIKSGIEVVVLDGVLVNKATMQPYSKIVIDDMPLAEPVYIESKPRLVPALQARALLLEFDEIKKDDVDKKIEIAVEQAKRADATKADATKKDTPKPLVTESGMLQRMSGVGNDVKYAILHGDVVVKYVVEPAGMDLTPFCGKYITLSGYDVGQDRTYHVTILKAKIGTMTYGCSTGQCKHMVIESHD